MSFRSRILAGTNIDAGSLDFFSTQSRTLMSHFAVAFGKEQRKHTFLGLSCFSDFGVKRIPCGAEEQRQCHYSRAKTRGTHPQGVQEFWSPDMCSAEAHFEKREEPAASSSGIRTVFAKRETLP
jgi:hypothetical protein